MSDAIAVGPATIVRIRKVAIIGLLHGDAAFADAFLLYMITRTRRVEEDLIDQLFNSSEKRLARALLQLAKIGKHNELPAAIPKLSQQPLAHMVRDDASSNQSVPQQIQRPWIHRIIFLTGTKCDFSNARA